MWALYYIFNAHFNYKILIQLRVMHRARLWSSIPTWWLALQVPQISTTEIANLVSFQREGKLLTKASSSFNLSVEMPGARKAALRKDMLAPAAMMQAGSRLIPHSRWKMQALGFFCKYRRWHSFCSGTQPGRNGSLLPSILDSLPRAPTGLCVRSWKCP